MNKDNLSGFGIGVLAGALIGGTLALLFAPKSGEELRSDIKNRVTKVEGDIKTLIGKAQINSRIKGNNPK
jgi:gas vesicle protein